MSTIDHEPRTPGEAVVVTVVTVVALIGLGWILRYVGTNFGVGWLAIAVAVELAIIFPAAFWLERRK